MSLTITIDMISDWTDRIVDKYGGDECDADGSVADLLGLPDDVPIPGLEDGDDIELTLQGERYCVDRRYGHYTWSGDVYITGVTYNPVDWFAATMWDSEKGLSPVTTIFRREGNRLIEVESITV